MSSKSQIPFRWDIFTTSGNRKYNILEKRPRSKIHYLGSENDFYCGHSYIACYDERIRCNGKTNDRCAADRELEIRGTLVTTRKVGFIVQRGSVEHSDVKQHCAARDIIRCVMCLAQYARLVYYSDILLYTDVRVIRLLIVYTCTCTCTLITWQSEMAYLAPQSMQYST